MLSLTSKDLSFSRILFASLADMHWSQETGVNRLGYSRQSYEASMHLCKCAQKSFGASCYQDLAGAIYIVSEPKDPVALRREALLMGSHVDAVPNGGQYDGIVGIATGLQVMKTMAKKMTPLFAPLVTVIFPNEESSRFEFATSAKACTGTLNPNAFEKRDALNSGETLAEAMSKHHKLDVEALRKSVENRIRLIPQKETAAFVEMHIEQSDTLANEGIDIGIIEQIKGSQRCGYVRFEGRADHSGACPQNERLDAIAGAGSFIVALEYCMKELMIKAPDLTLSFGDILVRGGGSLNIVSPNVEILFDIRSKDVPALYQSLNDVRAIGQSIAEQRGLKFLIHENDVRLQQPTEMDTDLIYGFGNLAHKLGLKSKLMPSGPSHDSAILQQDGYRSAVLFIPHTGGSHKVQERITKHRDDDPFDFHSGYANAVRMGLGYAMGEVITPQVLSDYPSQSERSPFVQKLLENGATPIFK